MAATAQWFGACVRSRMRRERTDLSHVPYLMLHASYLDSLQNSGIRPGLTRILAMLRALRHPERAYRSVIVAGTNGKGSVSSMIASILRESGERVGLYTSPHLVDIRERWLIDGEPIDASLL